MTASEILTTDRQRAARARLPKALRAIRAYRLRGLLAVSDRGTTSALARSSRARAGG